MNKVKKCPGKDSFQRINYLYQASNITATDNTASHVASVMYSNLLVGVAKKSVQRLGIDVKRTICKGCRCILLSGVTCRVRVKKKRARWTCIECNTVRTFPLQNRDYISWTERVESVKEVLDYGINDVHQENSPREDVHKKPTICEKSTPSPMDLTDKVQESVIMKMGSLQSVDAVPSEKEESKVSFSGEIVNCEQIGKENDEMEMILQDGDCNEKNLNHQETMDLEEPSVSEHVSENVLNTGQKLQVLDLTEECVEEGTEKEVLMMDYRLSENTSNQGEPQN